MASVSFGLNRGADSQPDQINVGTLAVTNNDLEVRIDNTKGWTSEEIDEYLKRIRDWILDSRENALAGY